MKSFGVSLVVVAVISLIIWGGYLGLARWQFNKNCGDYLKLAGDAPTVERADGFLEKAIAYIEKTNMVSGNSSIIFKKPTNDVGIWYAQIKAAKETTEKIIVRGEGVSQLERDNALMKIRETVLDQGERGTMVTTPDWISLFPYQLFKVILWPILSVLFAITGAIIVVRNDC
ncbi:MAG: hypothetical protein Q8N56_02990 [bacterium]|nr:hypothetical protein [bacterium]